MRVQTGLRSQLDRSGRLPFSNQLMMDTSKKDGIMWRWTHLLTEGNLTWWPFVWCLVWVLAAEVRTRAAGLNVISSQVSEPRCKFSNANTNISLCFSALILETSTEQRSLCNNKKKTVFHLKLFKYISFTAWDRVCVSQFSLFAVLFNIYVSHSPAVTKLG